MLEKKFYLHLELAPGKSISDQRRMQGGDGVPEHPSA